MAGLQPRQLVRCGSPSPRRRLKSLLGQRSGVAALEFAIIAPAFLLLIFGVLQISIVLYTQSVLDVSTRNAARMIQTGQVQLAGGSDTLFKSTLFAAFTGGMLNSANLKWTVQNATTFTALATTLAADGTAVPAQSTFSPGGPGSTVVVRVFYAQKLILPLVGAMLATSNGINLSSTTAFLTQNYQ